MSPLASAFDTLFQRANGVEILFHFHLIFFTKPTLKLPGVAHHEIEHACLALEVGANLFDSFSSVGIEEAVKNFLRAMHRRDWTTGTVMRKRLGTAI